MQKLIIYTEDKKNLADIVSRFFDGFTITKALGYYKGVPEQSAVITVLIWGSLEERQLGYKLADRIKSENNQESVILEVVKNTDRITFNKAATGSY